MDDFGNDYTAYMSTPACSQWYISITAYGGFDRWSPYSSAIL